jgi:hypothetical protein
MVRKAYKVQPGQPEILEILDQQGTPDLPEKPAQQVLLATQALLEKPVLHLQLQGQRARPEIPAQLVTLGQLESKAYKESKVFKVK